VKTKVKSHFSHKGKNYKPGDEFEGEDHEIQTLAQQGHVEHPQGQQSQGQYGGQQQGQPGQQGQHGGQQDPGKQDPGKSGR